MTAIRFKPDDNGAGVECGEFGLSSTACLGYLSQQVESYGLAADAHLRDWIGRAEQAALVPHLFMERARFMVADLLKDGMVHDVYCGKCAEFISSDSLLQQPWDDSHSEHGIRVGAAGYQVTCQKGHCLLVVCESIY